MIFRLYSWRTITTSSLIVLGCLFTSRNEQQSSAQLVSDLPAFTLNSLSTAQTLDLTFPEVAQFLNDRMGHFESPSKVRSTAQQLMRLCRLLGFQPSFILAVIEHESSFRSQVISPAGAVGLMQMLPATARLVGAPLGISVPHGGPNLKDPVVNLTLGMHYLARLRADFKSLSSTLAAYNMGPVQWQKQLARPKEERSKSVTRYVTSIHQTAKGIRFKASKALWKNKFASLSSSI